MSALSCPPPVQPDALARPADAVTQQVQLAATVSHELRTPLSALRVHLEAALLYPGEIDPRDTIRQALVATDRLESIVDDVLRSARSRLDPVPGEPVDLARLVTEELALSGPIPVRVHANFEVWVRASRIQLIRVLGNLVNNASRHAGTRVTIDVRAVADQAVVTVSDDGPGIPPADRERVFERFTRLDDARRRDPSGSGLGLAISRDIAHAHHGTLRIEDSPVGARFVLRLPLLAAAEPRPRKRSLPTPWPRQKYLPEAKTG
jgi:signal transduction histidine kinase